MLRAPSIGDWSLRQDSPTKNSRPTNDRHQVFTIGSSNGDSSFIENASFFLRLFLPNIWSDCRHSSNKLDIKMDAHIIICLLMSFLEDCARAISHSFGVGAVFMPWSIKERVVAIVMNISRWISVAVNIVRFSLNRMHFVNLKFYLIIQFWWGGRMTMPSFAFTTSFIYDFGGTKGNAQHYRTF